MATATTTRDSAQVEPPFGISKAAWALSRDAEIIDLHLDSFIPPRLWGYDLNKRHGLGFFRGRFFGHLDFPRALEAGLTGGMWSITTNPFRRESSRWRVFLRNLERFRTIVAGTEGRFELVRTRTEFDAVRARGAHGMMLSIQGGNAISGAPEGPASIPDDLVTRVTLVHLTNSCLGATSSPFALHRRNAGLTDRGRAMVEGLNAKRIFVDLAHINPAGFWDAVDVHDATQPLIATHTGVDGANKHWRNLDDAQVKAVADTGGVVGIIFATIFLKARGGPGGIPMILNHLEHVINVGGEDAAALGSDYDGAIIPPKALLNGAAMPRLIDGMLARKWSEARIRKVLGLNALRTFGDLRP